jgi:glycerol-3-phosphate acyltransferase PlsY
MNSTFHEFIEVYIMLIIGGIFLTVIAYALGSIPFGLVLTRMFTSIDIRETGSGNIGATNVRRMAGNLLGALTLIGDVLKGVLPVYLSIALFRGEAGSIPEIMTAFVAGGAFAGHLYPIYLKFKTGGKGVATALGCFLVISPLAVFLALILFGAVVKVTRRVSAGSLAATAFLSPAVGLITGSAIFSVCALLIAVMIFIRHRDNIKRLLSGTEPALYNR